MKVAFVAPFFGAGAGGGAESECRNTALRLVKAGAQVDIFTTCILDVIHDWNVNYYPQGTSSDHGLHVHRFRVDFTDLGAFFRLNERILKGETISRREEEQFISMHINSPGLYRALAARSGDYDWVGFIPYLFGTSYYGTMLCRSRKVLIPCLHDEPYARLGVFSGLFGRADRIVFHTRAEESLARRLYGGLDGKAVVMGEGIDTDFEADAARFRRTHGINRPFIFYVGRKDSTKNVDTLIRYFTFFKRRHQGDLALVLVGQGRLPVPAEMKEHIVDLGFVPEQDKRDAYAAASVVCQPSLNESFSIVIMESWVCGRPCLVHGGCAATREHAVRSGGGLYFEGYGEFEKCLELLLGDAELAGRLGEAGRRYVLDHFTWNRIVESFKAI